ncbi:MAG: hypothetical protein AB7S80_12280 [Rhizobiaceae bacterium]
MHLGLTRGLTAFAAAVVLGMLSLTAPAQAADLGPLGGRGGSPYDFRCRDGDALVAISIFHGTAVDSIHGVCARLTDDKKKWAAPTTYSPGERAGGGGGGHDLITCKKHDAIMAVRVKSGFAGDIYVVTDLAITCANLANPGKRYERTSEPQPIDVQRDEPLQCYLTSNTPWAVGLFGTAGTYVDGVGVHCGLTPTGGGTSPAEGPSDAECNAYGDRMIAMAQEANNLNCAFIRGSGGWNNSRDYWVRQCKKGGSLAAVNEPALEKQLNECRAAGENAQAGTLSVQQPVTVYNTYKDPKKDVCYLAEGDTVSRLSPAGAKAPWMRVKGLSGDCDGKAGFVYNDGELQ